MLTNTLIDFLMGESDGVPKDPKFIFRLYMALGKYPEAVRTANIIARQEQELGNYKSAHDLLYDTFRDLEADKKKVRTHNSPESPMSISAARKHGHFDDNRLIQKRFVRTLSECCAVAVSRCRGSCTRT